MGKVIHRCRRCRRPDDEVGKISKRGLCADCGALAVIEANRQQGRQEGPVYERWKQRWAGSPGASGRPLTPY